MPFGKAYDEDDNDEDDNDEDDNDGDVVFFNHQLRTLAMPPVGGRILRDACLFPITVFLAMPGNYSPTSEVFNSGLNYFRVLSPGNRIQPLFCITQLHM
jgi:hypothetical protein